MGLLALSFCVISDLEFLFIYSTSCLLQIGNHCKNSNYVWPSRYKIPNQNGKECKKEKREEILYEGSGSGNFPFFVYEVLYKALVYIEIWTCLPTSVIFNSFCPNSLVTSWVQLPFKSSSHLASEHNQKKRLCRIFSKLPKRNSQSQSVMGNFRKSKFGFPISQNFWDSVEICENPWKSIKIRHKP